MVFSRRRPREVYRLFYEDEYLALDVDEAAFPAVEGSGQTRARVEGDPDGVRAPRELRLARLASVAMLLGALGAIGWLIALSAQRSARGAGQRRAGGLPPSISRRESLQGSATPALPAGEPGSRGAGPRTPALRSVRRGHGRLSDRRRASRGRTRHAIGAEDRRRGRLTDSVRRPGAPADLSPAAAGGTREPAITSPDTRQAPVQRSEFGFESGAPR